MAYDNDFYKLYNEYIVEDSVRESHDRVFTILSALYGRSLHPKARTLDLGCGCGEFRTFGIYPQDDYFGVDKEKSPAADVVMDYTKELPELPWRPNIFVSLFSIEACLPLDERYALYEKVFETYPSVQVGLVSGFYYKSKPHKLTVIETGGLVSYQTIEPLLNWSDKLKETRVVLETPSNLFGEDVVEVWKFLERKED